MLKILNTIIIIIAASLIVAGCADDQYSMERRYWRLQKETEKILSNPQASPAGQLKQAVDSLSEFSVKYPKSPLSVDADFDIVRLYTAKEEYEEARAAAKRILDKYASTKSIYVEALFLIGNSYELEGNWDEALRQYRWILDNYPVSHRGLDIPIYIAQYYKAKHQPDKMVDALEDAITRYRSLINMYPRTPLALTASTLVAECYIALKDWYRALDTFNQIIAEYRDKAPMENLLLNMALIYHRELKDEAKAKEMLEKLAREHPDSNFAKQAESLLKEWSNK